MKTPNTLTGKKMEHKNYFWLASLIAALSFATASCNGGSEITDQTATETESGSLQIPTQNQENSAATEPSEQPHSESSQLNGRYSTVGDGVWPPQPVGVDNVQLYSPDSADNELQSIKLAAAKQMALGNEQVRLQLGNRYGDFPGHATPYKDGQLEATAIEFFNYSTNQIVTTTVFADSSIQVKQTPADEYQPPENTEEVKRSIALAANALRLRGHTDIDSLIGTALLAYPTAAEVAANGKQFYAQRKIYVTFGPGEGKTPRFRALVNLSTEIVEHSGPVR